MRYYQSLLSFCPLKSSRQMVRKIGGGPMGHYGVYAGLAMRRLSAMTVEGIERWSTQMAFSNPNPQPGIGAVKQAALQTAWAQVVKAFPAFAKGGAAATSLESALIRAIERAFASGERDVKELTNVALSVVPKLSRPNSLRR